MESINFFLSRPYKYQKDGRYESEEEAKLIDSKIKIALEAQSIKYTDFNSVKGEKKIVDEILAIRKIECFDSNI